MYKPYTHRIKILKRVNKRVCGIRMCQRISMTYAHGIIDKQLQLSVRHCKWSIYRVFISIRLGGSVVGFQKVFLYNKHMFRSVYHIYVDIVQSITYNNYVDIFIAFRVALI